MELVDLARGVGLPVRQLRYVVDNKLLPRLPLRPRADRAGRPRDLGNAEAFLVACAAALLCGGARRQTVARVMELLDKAPCPFEGLGLTPCSPRQLAARLPATALDALWRWNEGEGRLQIGDGSYVRIVLGDIDTGWFEPRGAHAARRGLRAAGHDCGRPGAALRRLDQPCGPRGPAPGRGRSRPGAGRAGARSPCARYGGSAAESERRFEHRAGPGRGWPGAVRASPAARPTPPARQGSPPIHTRSTRAIRRRLRSETLPSPRLQRADEGGAVRGAAARPRWCVTLRALIRSA